MPKYDRDPAVAFRLKDGIELAECGCLHDGKNGHALLVCATHVASVEGMKGYFRLRGADGDLRLVPVFGTASGRATDLLTATDVRPDADGLRRPVAPPVSGLARPPEEKEGYNTDPTLRPGDYDGTTPDRPISGPSEESLCGEEEALAAGSFGDPEDESAPLPEQLRQWARHVRGVGRSRQSAYAEALSLAQMQFAAWQQAFPLAYAQAAEAREGLPLNAREREILDMYAAGFRSFLAETHRIAKAGGA